MIEDAAQALRTLLRRPRAPLLGALWLSVGLGVAAAVFSLLDATLLRPSPGTDPGAAGGSAVFDGILAYFRGPLIVARQDRNGREREK